MGWQPHLAQSYSLRISMIHVRKTLLLDPRLAAGDLAAMVAKSPAGYL